MHTLVLYTSNTGCTKAYAEKIAQAMSTEAVALNKHAFNKMDLSSYDTIVFGGWVMGSKIQGVDDFLSRWDDMADKNVIVFSSGMGYVSKESRDNMISSNVLDLYHLRYYQLRGSFDYSKLRFPKTLMIKLGIQGAKRTHDSGTDIDFLEEAMRNKFEYDDVDGVNRIISVLHRISSEQKA